MCLIFFMRSQPKYPVNFAWKNESQVKKKILSSYNLYFLRLYYPFLTWLFLCFNYFQLFWRKTFHCSVEARFSLTKYKMYTNIEINNCILHSSICVFKDLIIRNAIIGKLSKTNFNSTNKKKTFKQFFTVYSNSQ